MKPERWVYTYASTKVNYKMISYHYTLKFNSRNFISETLLLVIRITASQRLKSIFGHTVRPSCFTDILSRFDTRQVVVHVLWHAFGTLNLT